jgi:predicted  nucleic acid-binding Zn-ribbon protein
MENEGAIGMNDLSELQRRIMAALDRIGQRIADDSSSGPQARAPEPRDDSEEIARLREALEVERSANAQLTERLRAVKERDAQAEKALEIRVEAMTRQLDVQGLEIQRMRKSSIQLREQLRALREAAAEAAPDAHLINKSMLAELEALRATRASETAELSEIIAELTPILQEMGEDA